MPLLMELPRLPDEMWVEILSYLSTAELLQARAVCRQLRDVALQPALWAHRTVYGSDPFAIAVLQLVPRLESLVLRSSTGSMYLRSQSVLALLREAAVTSCAVDDLRLPYLSTETENLIVEVVGHSASLGQLKRLSLALDFCSVSSETVDAVLAAMKEGGVGHLSVEHYEGTRHPYAKLKLTLSADRPFLRSLLYSCDTPSTLLAALLERHRSTLTSVTLSGAKLCGQDAVAQLADFPALREVHVRGTLVPSALTLPFAILRCLHLDVKKRAQKPAEAALAQLLPKATQLQELVFSEVVDDSSLWMSTMISRIGSRVITLIAALGSSGESGLERLVLRHRVNSSTLWLLSPKFASYSRLSAFSRLRCLELPHAMWLDTLLEGFTARTTPPSLRYLRVELCSSYRCSVPGVRSLLARLPRLRVESLGEHRDANEYERCVAAGHPAEPSHLTAAAAVQGQPPRLATAFHGREGGQPVAVGCSLHRHSLRSVPLC